jgi:hypothetical protein
MAGRATAVRRLIDWATIDKTSKIFDLAFKAGVIAVALTYLFRPDVHADLPTPTAVFVDREVLQQRYPASGVPTVVDMVAKDYNSRNEADIKRKSNTTLSQLPLSSLCDNVDLASMIVKVTEDKDACKKSKLGRGRYYERYLLVLNECFRRPDRTLAVSGEIITCNVLGQSMEAEQLKAALGHLHAAEYRRSELSVENGGSVRANHIHVVVAPEFTLSALHPVVQGTAQAPLTPATASERDRRKDSEVRGNDFALEPGERLLLAYTTARGSADPGTEDRFQLDWKERERSDFTDLVAHATWPIRIFVGILVALFAFFFATAVISDYRHPAPPPAAP